MSRRSLLLSGLAGVGTLLIASCGSAAPAQPTAAAAAPTTAPAAAPTTAPTAAPTPAAAAQPTATAAPAAAAPAKAGQTTVTYWMTTPLKEDDAITIPKFEKENPDIKIQGEWLPGGGMFEKLQTSYAAGQSPDTHIVFIGWIYDFFNLGMLEPLNAFAKDTFKTDNFPDDKYVSVGSKAITFEGKLAGVPMGMQQIFMYWNQDMFKAAGIPEPDKDPNYSYDKLLEDAKKLTKGSGDKVEQWGFAAHWAYPGMDSAILSNGGRLLSEDLKESRIDSPENLATLQWFVDTIQVHKVSPTPTIYQDTAAAKLLLSGKIGIHFDGGWVLADIQKDPNFNGQIGMMPAGKVKRVTTFWPDSMAISSTSKVKEAGWRWLVYMTTNPAPAFYRYVVPFVRAASADPSWLDKDRKGNKQVVLDQIKNWVPQETGSKWNEWRAKIVNSEFQAAMLGEKKPAEALKAAHNQVNEILKRK
jgi:ABC-type glycerol-3-phosphate transport system substrate-binding protein